MFKRAKNKLMNVLNGIKEGREERMWYNIKYLFSKIELTDGKKIINLLKSEGRK